MTMLHRLCLVVLVLLAWGISPLEGAHLKGRIARIGYPGSGADSGKGQDHYRQDSWVPVLVELENEDGDQFTGTLEVRQKDRDGDEVAARWPVVLRDEVERIYLYVPSGIAGTENWSGNGQSFRVRIYDDEGQFAPLFDENDQPITALDPPRPLTAVSGGTKIILDISERPINPLALVSNDPDRATDVVVTRIGPAEIPPDAVGLAMVDIIVWDGADPTLFRDPAQRQALVEWVRQGGVLVIGVSDNWNRLENSEQLAKILPVKLSGKTEITEPTEGIGQALQNNTSLPLMAPLGICEVMPEDLRGDAYVSVPSNPDEDPRVLVARRKIDQGEVVLVTAELEDLLAIQGTNARDKMIFLQQVTLLRTSPRDMNQQTYGRRNPFEQVETLIGFATDTVLYFFFGFVFVIGYILLATAGVWFGLKRRGMVQHSWTVFALVTLVTSGLSLAAVRLVRGIGSTVQEVQVVDLEAGTSMASSECYFGLKTATHVEQDLKLPMDATSPEESPGLPGGLRPLPVDMMDPMMMQRMYSNTLQYRSLAGIGQLEDVPFRATLKKMQGTWRGTLEGDVIANLRHGSRAYLSDDSWIENRLGTTLNDCYLFVAARNPQPRLLPRVFVYDVDQLEHGERFVIKTYIDAKTKREKTAAAIAQGQRSGPDQFSRFHNSWLNNIGYRDYTAYGMNQNERRVKVDEKGVVSSLLLLSTYSEVDPNVLEKRSVVRPTGANLDCATLITEDRALFVGFSRDPGPAKLFGRNSENDDWDAYGVSDSLVMYRVWIPVK